MDISNTTEPKSDQQNYDDYIAGPKTVTVAEVKKGTAEQPVEIHLVEFPGRPYKPSKSMRRVLVTCWGPEASAYAGRQMTLYGDPAVRFGGQEVGGIKIAELSDITEPKSIQLTVTRGKRAPFVVKPIDLLRALEGAPTLDALQAAWRAAVAAGTATRPDIVAAKERRKAELTTNAGMGGSAN